MTEALTPVIQFGFEVMGLTLIDADVERANARSLALLERLGFVNVGSKGTLCQLVLRQPA